MTAMRMPDDLSTGVEFNFQFQIIKHFCYVRYGEKLSPTQLLYSSKVTKKESTRMDVKEADVEVEVEDDVDLELQQQRGGNGDENSSDDQQKGSPHTTLVSEEPATASLPSENPKRESSPDETEPRVRKWDPENLYLESATMLLGSFLMFCLPDLRAVARQGLLKGDPEQIQRILDLPATVKDISTIYSENKELLTAERLKDPDRAQMYEDALALTFDKGYLFDEADRDHAMKNSILVALDDANEQENCVYMISFNPYKSRVGVYFRGSVTKKDFRQDAKALLSLIPNPAQKMNPDLPDDLLVHHGFKEYLYSDEDQFLALGKFLERAGIARSVEEMTRLITKRAVSMPPLPKLRLQSTNKQGTTTTNAEETDPQEETVSKEKKKFQIILDQVAAICVEHPQCRLHIGGHSLGGALATMLSLEAASDERIPSPVTCITSGAPKVGNLDFLRTYDYLEEQGRVRCIQVANDRDPVTLSPPTGAFNPIHAICCQSGRFRHVGLRITLRKYGYIITYPMKMTTYFGTLFCDMMLITRALMIVAVAGFLWLLCLSACFVIAVPFICCYSYRAIKNSRQHHTQLKYIERLQHIKPDLEQQHLDKLNERRWRKSRWRVPVLHTYSERYGYCGILDCYDSREANDEEQGKEFDAKEST